MKILIISSNLIGDTILSTGVINYFHIKFPKAKFTFLVGPSAGQIYDNFTAAEKIILVKKKKYNLHWLSMYSKVFRIKWDIIIDFRSSLISYFLLKNKKFIFKKKKNLNQKIQLKNFFNLKKLTLCVSTSKNDEIEVSKVLNTNYRYVVLFPGGNWKPKIWPINYFNKLIDLLNIQFSDLRFIIVGSLEEKKIYYDDIKKNHHNDYFLDLMGESLSATSAYMKKSNLFIGNDSGLMHLSVASNLKTIALFGPTDDNIYGHKDSNSFVIRTNKNYDEFDQNKIDASMSYMNSIEPDLVFDFIINNKLL